jgi:hypothetical protein
VKLADAALNAQAFAMSELMDGAELQLWDDLTLLASVKLRGAKAGVGQVSFGPLAPATAVNDGAPSLFRIVSSGGSLILEGSSSELNMEPTSTIEKGGLVRVTGITYRHPAGNL